MWHGLATAEQRGPVISVFYCELVLAVIFETGVVLCCDLAVAVCLLMYAISLFCLYNIDLMLLYVHVFE